MLSFISTTLSLSLNYSITTAADYFFLLFALVVDFFEDAFAVTFFTEDFFVVDFLADAFVATFFEDAFVEIVQRGE